MSKNHQDTPTITCPACGTSPVNHRLFLIINTIDDALLRTLRNIFGWINIPQEGPVMNMVNKILVGFFRMIGVARLNEDRTKVATGRSELIWEEAHRRGIKMQQVVMFGKHLDQYRAKIDGKWFYFQSIPTPHWLPQKGYEWIDDKLKLAEELARQNIPAPKAIRVKTFSEAKIAFESLQKPLIIKPRLGSRSRHTTTNIKTIEELRYAYDTAKQIAIELVVEEHLFGSVHRATVINNKLVGFFQANPPQITGDGIRSVQEIITQQNKNRPEKIGEIKISADTLSFIDRFGLTLESILPLGTTIDLTAKTGRFYGGYTKEMLPEIHPKLHDYFSRASIATDASIVGFDVIILDPKADPDEQRWGIIECNSLPFIDLHYFAFEGPRLNIAENIWDLWEAKFPVKGDLVVPTKNSAITEQK